MTFRGRALLASLLLALVVSAGDARADDTAIIDAKRSFEDAERAYALGDYQKAITGYTRSFELSGRPALLFNIAQAHRLAGNVERARFFYKTYLDRAPDATNRAEVERRIIEMTDELARRASAPPVVPPPTDPPADPPIVDPPVTTEPPTKIPSPDRVAETAPAPTPELPPEPRRSGPIYKRWWFWTGVGALAIGSITAVVLLSSDSDDVTEPMTTFGRADIF